MRAPLSWIREFAPIEGSTSEIADALNSIGLVVEAIHEPGREIGGVIVAKVLAVADHPDADKLTLVDVDHGSGEARVVCGARNLTAGDVIPYAPPGATLPGGMKLERRKIRGQVSEGMLCSERELGLGDDHGGIMHLPVSTPLGAEARVVLGLDDVVFDLEITPNRPDAMSIVGVARDLAAACRVPMKVPEPAVTGDERTAGELASLAVEAPDRCPRYVARVASVTVAPSPDWMAQRLTLAGMRPISNVVDVTNYVLLERGQPLHAFDLDLLGGGGILVRLARVGERMSTLDGVERTLTDEDLLICDAAGAPQAIAGIMGGGSSEVSQSTTSVLLESAYFAPTGILRSSKRLGLRTESSARFERGVDPNGVAIAADRACELFAQVASGRIASGALDAYPAPVERARIVVRIDRVNTLLGTELTPAQLGDYLTPLGIELGPIDVAPGAPVAFEATIPTFRPDLEREVDLTEEVARHHGYNNILRTVPRSGAHAGGLTARQREQRKVRDLLVGAGLLEAMTFSLVAPADLTRAGMPAVGIEVENPLRAEESLLRPALLPGLLRSVAFNAAHGMPDVALFEVGHVFGTPLPGETLPDERDHLAVVLAGSVVRAPHEPDRSIDVHDVVGIWELLADALGLADQRLVSESRPGLHPSRSAAIFVDGVEVGVVGEVAEDVAKALDLPRPAVALEVDLDRVLAGARDKRDYVAPSRFPASSIDLAFIVGEVVSAADLQSTLATAAGPMLEELRLFDVFRAESIGAGHKSLAFALRFRAHDRTLTDDEVAGLRQSCINSATKSHHAVLRG